MKSVTATLVLLMTALSWGTSAAETHRLESPDGKVALTFTASGEAAPTYSVEFDGRPILAPSELGLDLAAARLAGGLKLTGVRRASTDRSYELVAGKAARARDHFNELVADLEARPAAGGPPRRLQLLFRAYDDGVAFRYRAPAASASQPTEVRAERTRFVFPKDYACWGLNLGRYQSAFEGEFDPVPVSRIREHNLYTSPLVCSTGERRTTFAIAEADLSAYAGMYLAGDRTAGPAVQVRLSPRLDDPRVAVRTRAGADLVSPWRVVMLAREPGLLNESNLITSLNPPADFDASWVKPGKTAWDWWNGPSLAGVASAGMNDATMKGFIDFAAEAGLPYMLIDAGWYRGDARSAGADPTRSIPELDVPALVEYGRRKGVGVWLWVHWSPLDANLEEALATYERWGVKGIKVDFMDRNDQQMVEWYNRLLAGAAAHRLMVDLHGAYPPTGLARTFPNFVTQEGVLGAEYNKWTSRITARHNVTLAFTRLILGPMDYTPGGFSNVSPAAFAPSNILPSVMTTRAHGLAMYVVYESPFAGVSDSPDVYRASPAGLDFIRDVPVTWDETRVLAGEIGEYIVVARRKGREWWLGAMTNETGRTLQVPLERLGGGRFAARVWGDGAGPKDFAVGGRKIAAGEPLALTLAPNGGAAIRLSPG